MRAGKSLCVALDQVEHVWWGWESRKPAFFAEMKEINRRHGVRARRAS
jgi:hypothetical protein